MLDTKSYSFNLLLTSKLSYVIMLTSVCYCYLTAVRCFGMSKYVLVCLVQIHMLDKTIISCKHVFFLMLMHYKLSFQIIIHQNNDQEVY